MLNNFVIHNFTCCVISSAADALTFPFSVFCLAWAHLPTGLAGFSRRNIAGVLTIMRTFAV